MTVLCIAQDGHFVVIEVDFVDKHNLVEMEWDLPQYHWGKEVHMQKMREIGQQIAKELQT